MATPLALTNVRLPDGSGPVWLLLRDGSIERIEHDGPPPGPGVEQIDGGGGVVLPRFIDAHMHLDKTLMGEPWMPLPDAPTLRERITTAEEIVLHRTTRTIRERAEILARSALSYGTLALRSHADVTPGLGLRGFEALLEVRQELAGLVDIQVVAFPQAGVLAPGVAELLEEALRQGADVLGGLDPAGYDSDLEGVLGTLFRLAGRYDVPLDIHLHDHGPLGLAELDRIAALTDADGYGGRVAVSHAFALGDAGELEVRPTLERLARAGVAIITAATGNTPIPRARDLWAAGVAFGIGSDNVHDGWAPFGRGDVLEKAFLFAYRNGLRTDADLGLALDAITRVNAGILRYPAGAVAVGAPADLVVVDAENGAEAVAAHPPRRVVIRAGRVLYAAG